mmetsp:Transcript_10471/g.12889  ORF Transcript_10471/g.12889 Transcript_10471/m.12889 type:complete len:87 (-) Transcript_10471:203-463(-)
MELLGEEMKDGGVFVVFVVDVRCEVVSSVAWEGGLLAEVEDRELEQQEEFDEKEVFWCCCCSGLLHNRSCWGGCVSKERVSSGEFI